MRCSPPLVRVLCAALAASFLCPPAQLLAQDPPAPEAGAEDDFEPVLDTSGLDRLDVDPTTGELLFGSEDLVVGEGAQAFRLVRTWRPFSGDAADFGHHWASPLSIHLDVDGDGSRAGLVDAGGMRTFFTRDEQGALRSISGRPGRIAVQADAFLVSGLGDERTYRFDRDGFLREVTGAGVSLRYAWDAERRLTSIDGPWGRIALERDGQGRLARVVAPGEVAVSYLFDEEGNLVRVVRPGAREVYGYDTYGRLRSLAEGQAQLVWDSASRVTAIRGEGVQPVAISYLQSDDRTRALTTTVVREGRTRTITVSADRRRVAWSEDGFKETVVALDAHERPLQVRSADGRTWSWTYDSRGRPVQTKSPSGTVSYEYGSKVTDRPTRVELEDGRQVVMSYDLRGLLVALEATGAGKRTWTYDEQGRMVEAVDARGAVTRYTWDDRSLLIGVEEVGLGTTKFGRDAQGRVRAVKTESGALVRVEYDPQGRVRLVHDARGTIMAATHDARGNLVRYLDELGQETTWTWNARGEMVEARDALGLIGKWTYAAGRLASFTDGAGNETRWRRPDARTLIVEDPTAGTRTLSLDAAGRLIKEVRAGVELGYRYDALGNLAVRSTPAGEETFARDALGRLVGLAGPAGALELRWGEDGRLAAIKEKAFGREVAYGYSPAGDKTELHLPWGTVKYRYDAHGRVTGIDLPSGEALEIALDASGRRQSITYPNGVVTRFGWDRGRLVEVHTVKGEETIDRRRYGWGARGRLEWMEDAAGRRTTYEHDARGRLVAAKGPYGEQRWTYDLANNRTSEALGAEQTRIEVGAGNRVTARGATRLEHTASGAVSTIGATRLVHDHDDHLVRVENPDGTKVEYGYAPNGTRLWRQDAKGRTWYLNDLSDVVAELDADGKVVAGYVHGPEADDVLAAVKGGESYFYHYDLVRSVTAVTGKGGRVAARYAYDAFGREQEAQGDAVAWNPFRWTSREHDATTGLYHFRARTYSTELGRFTSPDPLGRMGGVNLYAYVDNDPTIFNDPFGLDPKKPWWKRAWDTAKDWGSTAVNYTKALGAAVAEDFSSGMMGRKLVAFGKGFGKGLWGAAKGIYNMVRHPVDTWNGIVYAIENWEETKEALLAKWEEYKDAAVNDPEKFAEMTGYLTAEILTSVAGTKGLDKVGKLAKAADLGKKASTLARTTGVTRVVNGAGNAVSRALPTTARTVRTGSRWSGVRNVELARRAATPGNIITRTGRRIANVGRDVTAAGRMAARNPGAFVVYTGHRMSRAAAGLVASTGRGVWGVFTKAGIPTVVTFEDQITDAINRTASREAAMGDLSDKGRRLLADAGRLDPDELARRLDEVSDAYDTYRNRLLAPVHAEDEELGRRLKALSDEVEAGRIAPEAIDSRMNALLLEFARRRMVVLEDVYGRNKDAAHDMWNPSPNRLVSFADEAAYLDELLKRVTDPRARAAIEARKAELAERARQEEERYMMGEFDSLISGVAGPPRDPASETDGSSLDALIAPAAPTDSAAVDEPLEPLDDEMLDPEPAPRRGPSGIPGDDQPWNPGVEDDG